MTNDACCPALAPRRGGQPRAVLPDDGAPRATYVPDAESMRGAWGKALTDRLTSLRAASVEGAAPARGTAPFPVIVFSPGGGQKVLTYSALLEDLASHGYIVAAIEPPYNAPAVRFPDGTLVMQLPESERGWPRASTLEMFLQNYRERVLHWAKDISFVLDQLTRLNAGPGLLAGRIRVQRAGAIGHSFGGLGRA
jgi:predicted dienelactone hydrolase